MNPVAVDWPTWALGSGLSVLHYWHRLPLFNAALSQCGRAERDIADLMVAPSSVRRCQLCAHTQYRRRTK